MKHLLLASLPALLLLPTTPPTPLANILPLHLSAEIAQPTTASTPLTQANQKFDQGVEYYQSGQFPLALQLWQDALTLYRSVPDQQGEKATLAALGEVAIRMGNPSQALTFLEPALALAQQTHDRRSEAQALANLGIVHRTRGNYASAIASLQQALAIVKALQADQWQAQILTSLGNTYEALGDYDRALTTQEQSLALARQLGNRESESIALSNLGIIYENRNQPDLALNHYQQSAAIAKELNDPIGQAYVLLNIGSVHLNQNRYGQAKEAYQQSLTLAQTQNDRRLESLATGALGTAYEDEGNLQRAIALYQDCLTIAQEVGDPHTLALSFNNLGHALYGAEQYAEAETNLRQALDLLESLRPGLSDSQNVSVFDTQVMSYNLLQQILVAQHKYDEALETAEKGRARAFVELLAKQLPNDAAVLQNATAPNIQKIRQIAQEQKSTFVLYSIVPDDDVRFQGKQRGPESKLYTWVVQPSGKLSFQTVDLKQYWQAHPEQQRLSLTELVTLVRASLGGRSATISVEPDAEAQAQQTAQQAQKLQQLYQLLIAPIEQHLPTNPNTPIVFIPQDALFLVPFPALQNAEGKYLIENHTVLTAPAIQILDLTRQQRLYQRSSPKQTPLVVGNPTMPLVSLIGASPQQLPSLLGAEQEAKEIASLLNTQPLLGSQATKATVMQQMSTAPIIHLATHGLLDDLGTGIPGAIALAPNDTHQPNDGLLSAAEIAQMQLRAELVVLSACDTGQGLITGDGVIGLSRSLITAGAASVIVSLWAVPDAPTAELMTEFYRQLNLTGNKAQALRQAMLKIQKEHPNPKNWAAFTLIGEAQ